MGTYRQPGAVKDTRLDALTAGLSKIGQTAIDIAKNKKAKEEVETEKNRIRSLKVGEQMAGVSADIAKLPIADDKSVNVKIKNAFNEEFLRVSDLGKEAQRTGDNTEYIKARNALAQAASDTAWVVDAMNKDFSNFNELFSKNPETGTDGTWYQSTDVWRIKMAENWNNEKGKDIEFSLFTRDEDGNTIPGVNFGWDDGQGGLIRINNSEYKKSIEEEGGMFKYIENKDKEMKSVFDGVIPNGYQAMLETENKGGSQITKAKAEKANDDLRARLMKSNSLGMLVGLDPKTSIAENQWEKMGGYSATASKYDPSAKMVVKDGKIIESSDSTTDPDAEIMTQEYWLKNKIADYMMDQWALQDERIVRKGPKPIVGGGGQGTHELGEHELKLGLEKELEKGVYHGVQYINKYNRPENGSWVTGKKIIDDYEYYKEYGGNWVDENNKIVKLQKGERSEDAARNMGYNKMPVFRRADESLVEQIKKEGLENMVFFQPDAIFNDQTVFQNNEIVPDRTKINIKNPRNISNPTDQVIMLGLPYDKKVIDNNANNTNYGG